MKYSRDSSFFSYLIGVANSWYAVFGAIVAGIAFANFVFSLLNINLSLVISTLLGTYKAIVHGGIDWVLSAFSWRLPDWAKDVIFLYGLAGGAFVRARAGEGIYPNDATSVRKALRALLFRRDEDGGVSLASPMTRMYQKSPKWLKAALDFTLWPRVAKQYFLRPMVYLNEYLGTYPTFSASYKPGSHKIFIYDRRKIFIAHAVIILLVFSFIVIINAFLVIPS